MTSQIEDGGYEADVKNAGGESCASDFSDSGIY